MKIIAFYLPQFHPIPENDEWWMKGFTEWFNVAKAKPLFLGHDQPKIPSDLGFYDLRVIETMYQQALLAKEYGINGFCFYHYWFNGKLLLERPVENFLNNQDIDLEYCLCWANESWTANWVGNPNKILLEQTYPGEIDIINHIGYLSKFFKDKRYIRINDRPVLIFFKPLNFPETKKTLNFWRKILFEKYGYEMFFIGIGNDHRKILENGYDGVITYSLKAALNEFLTPKNKLKELIKHRVFRMPRWVINYKDLLPYLCRNEWNNNNVFPDVLPNWDNSPRLGKNALVLKKSSPRLFKELLQYSQKIIEKKPIKYQVIFIKSWNEWAEGNYIEPDLKNGKKYLEAIFDVFNIN